jgi:hypothetical protein
MAYNSDVFQPEVAKKLTSHRKRRAVTALSTSFPLLWSEQIHMTYAKSHGELVDTAAASAEASPAEPTHTASPSCSDAAATIERSASVVPSHTTAATPRRSASFIRVSTLSQRRG